MSDTKVVKGNVVVSEWSNHEIAYAVTAVGKVLFYAYPVDGKRSDLYSFSIDGTDWQVIAETVREYRKLATDHAAFLDRAASTTEQSA